MDQANIYWLASYPKSGNTWTRAFIANLREDSDCPVPLNEIKTGAIASSKAWIERGLGFDVSELTIEELESLRPAAYLQLANKMTRINFHKTHDAYSFVSNGVPLFPTDVTRGALYIVRNPLDVAVSFSHHMGTSVDKAIRVMEDPEAGLAKGVKSYHEQARMRLMTWSGHVDSWLSAISIKRHISRYEDMRSNPLVAFTKIANFLELPSTEEKIARAIAHCDLRTLQAMERKGLFYEKPFKAERFFRKGQVGDWQTALSTKQVDRIIGKHGQMMEVLGYLNKAGSPDVLPLPQSPLWQAGESL